MKNVMTKAWEIARKGAKKYGGSVKQYFAEALKMAWAIVKQTATTVTIQLAEGSRKHKTWVARIAGTHARYGLDRKFIDGAENDDVRGLFFTLVEGEVYDINCGRDGRKFAAVHNGQLVELSQNEVKAIFA